MARRESLFLLSCALLLSLTFWVGCGGTVSSATPSPTPTPAPTPTPTPSSGAAYVYVNVEKDIYAFQMDMATGELTPVPDSPFTVRGSQSCDMCSGYLLGDPAGRYLFDAWQGLDAALVTFQVDGASGALTQTDSVTPMPNSISIDPQGRFVVGLGNSGGPAVMDFVVDRSANKLSPAPGMPYPYEAPTQVAYMPPAASNSMAYALSYCSPQCGNSKNSLWNGWRFDSATGALSPLFAFPVNAGGQYMIGQTITPDGKFLYAEEQWLDNGVGKLEVVGYGVNPDGSLSRLSGSQQTPDEGVEQLLMSPNGKFLYHNGGEHKTVYAIDQSTGALTLTADYQNPSGGPGWIAIDPTLKYLYMGGDKAIDGFKVNATTGEITPLPDGKVSLPNEPGTVSIVKPQ